MRVRPPFIVACVIAISTGSVAQERKRGVEVSPPPGVVVTAPDGRTYGPARGNTVSGSSSVARIWAFEPVRLVRAVWNTNHTFATCIAITNYNDQRIAVSPVVFGDDGRPDEAVSGVFRDRLREPTGDKSQAAGFATMPAGAGKVACWAKGSPTSGIAGTMPRIVVFASHPVHVNVYGYYHTDPWETAVGFPVNCDGGQEGVEFLCRFSARALSGSAF